MSPVTHFLIGWLTAESSDFSKRERMLVTVAGVIPDLDGIGLIAELLTQNSENPLAWYSLYHHVLGHNLTFALLYSLFCYSVARQKLNAAFFAFISFHLHLLCDLVGSGGADGYRWPIEYLWPFSDRWQWEWSGQWQLSAWPNILITILALLMTMYLARQRGYSPLEMISAKADQMFVTTLQQRFKKS